MTALILFYSLFEGERVRINLPTIEVTRENVLRVKKYDTVHNDYFTLCRKERFLHYFFELFHLRRSKVIGKCVFFFYFKYFSSFLDVVAMSVAFLSLYSYPMKWN